MPEARTCASGHHVPDTLCFPSAPSCAPHMAHRSGVADPGELIERGDDRPRREPAIEENGAERYQR